MNAPTYAGIGARATPKPVLADMTTIAAWLARTGWRLASGGAHGPIPRSRRGRRRLNAPCTSPGRVTTGTPERTAGRRRRPSLPPG